MRSRTMVKGSPALTLSHFGDALRVASRPPCSRVELPKQRIAAAKGQCELVNPEKSLVGIGAGAVER